MNNRQQASLDAMNRVLSLVNNPDYAAIFSGIEDFDDEKKNLQDAIAKMMGSGVIQTGKDDADEDTVLKVKTTMAETVIKFALRGLVKARKAGNLSLANALDEPVTYILNATKTEAVLRAQTLTNVMNENLAVLTNISGKDVQAMQAGIDDYSKIKEDPLSDRKQRKAMGTDAIPKAEKEGKAAMENMDALVRSYLETENPELTDLFRLAMEQTNTAIRHTTVEITTVQEEDNEPVEGASVLDEKTGKTFTTDDEGLAELGKHINGDDTFVVSAPGRETVTVGFTIVSRRDNAFVVKLRKKL